MDLKRLSREIDSGRSSSIAFDSSPPFISSVHSLQTSRRSPRFLIAASGAVIFITALVFAWLFRPVLPPPRVTGFTQLTHDGWPKTFWSPTVPIVLTDGARLYIQENIHGRFIVAQVSASGGDTIPINTPFQNVSLNTLSSDQSELIIGSFTGSEEWSFYAIPTLGGAPRRLTNLTGNEATWMPN